jgi:hypothetical protein
MAETIRFNKAVLEIYHLLIYGISYNIFVFVNRTIQVKVINSRALVRQRTIPTVNRRLSAKLVPTLGDRWCRVVSATNPHGRYFLFSRPEPLLFFQVAEWTRFQIHYFSENLVALGIEPGTSGSVARNSDH